MTDAPSSAVGFVAIGRNEGERLRRCLAALSAGGGPLVYVDSGSTDGSRELARSFGACVEELDLSAPFTAARGRNVGFERLMREAPATQFVQFVDGDCELREGWIDSGLAALREHGDVGVVCGRRRERAPEASVYNRLCDVEWDTPVGEARACGGDALIRAQAFRRAGGYDPGMIAGEEPDLCLRLRRLGYRILRLDAEMTRHDAAMTRWTQWWQRAVRTGHTTAELLGKYGATPEHGRLRRAASDLFWAVGLPLASALAVVRAAAAPGIAPLAVAVLVPLVAYALLLLRVDRGCRRRGRSSADARAYALSCVLAKWPETWGLLMYVARRISGRRARWIEYKSSPGAVPPQSSSLKRALRTTADRTARWTGLLARRERESAAGLTVLMYHRVLEEARCATYPHPGLAMPLGAFREQVRWLARHGEVLPLGLALERNAAGARRDRPLFALTFDDGYEDAHRLVAGVLEEAGLRGTFFVTTGFVGGKQPLWFDRACLLLAAVPEQARREACLAACSKSGAAAPPRAGSDVRAWTALLKRLQPGERDAFLAALEREAGGAPTADGFDALSVAQLVALHRRGHEIGSHTVTHAMLPQLDDDAVRRELAEARQCLSAWLGAEAPGFCYPNGDHDGRVAALVAAAGHAYACTALDGIHGPLDDPFRIRRVAVMPDRVADGSRRFDATAFRRELCGLYRSRGHAAAEG